MFQIYSSFFLGFNFDKLLKQLNVVFRRRYNNIGDRLRAITNILPALWMRNSTKRLIILALF